MKKTDRSSVIISLCANKLSSLHSSQRKTAEVKETLQSMQKDRLSVGHWVGKYQQNHEKKREKRREKAEAQHAKYIASKSHGPQQSLLDELLDWYVC
ncbi:putative ABC transporter ATP-binding protein [Dissostichus eleginoides]|uniref:ABC transporter ATP-binding protein n=1 Tax=Dissostichus eleginoides TaxID=100907 RepID=A0AAD9CJQ1_DISEL|nr:putative ABC transporter ATP-binding protein [Dissostichus eleginoides]